MTEKSLDIPKIGFGVYQMNSYEECFQSVTKALNAGYRLIDTAAIYGNEKAVGAAIKQSNLDRSEIVITSKVWVNDFGYSKTAKAKNDSIARLEVEYIDLMLLHQPFGDVKGSWRALEEAYESGLIHSIGVSNFTISDLSELMSTAKIKPSINQVECHPYFPQNQLKEFMQEFSIGLEAWYPIGHGNKSLLTEEVFSELAKKYKKSAVQIILRWHIQSGNIPLPKSTNEQHIRDNIDIFDFVLSQEEMERIDKLDKGKSFFKINPVMKFFMKHMKVKNS